MPKPQRRKKNTRGLRKGTSTYQSKTRKPKKHTKQTKHDKGQKTIRKLRPMTVNVLFFADFPDLLIKAFQKEFPPPMAIAPRDFVIWLTSKAINEYGIEQILIWTKGLICAIAGDVPSISKTRNIRQIRTWLLKRC